MLSSGAQFLREHVPIHASLTRESEFTIKRVDPKFLVNAAIFKLNTDNHEVVGVCVLNGVFWSRLSKKNCR